MLQAAVTAAKPVSPNVNSASRRLIPSPLVPVRTSGPFELVAMKLQFPPPGLAACSLYAAHLLFIISITIYFYSEIIKLLRQNKYPALTSGVFEPALNGEELAL